MSSATRILWSRKTLYIAPLLILGISLIYLPVVQVDFLFRDDYVYFTLPKGWTLTRIALAQARPFLGIFVDVLNTSVVAGAGLKHFVPVLGLGMLAVSIYAWLRNNGLRRIAAMLLGLSVCCVSSFQDTVCYLTVCSSIYASLCSCLAVQVFFRDCVNPEQSRRARLLRAMPASLLLFLGLSCYQPGAMFCWAVLIVPIYLANNEDWPRFRWAFLQFGLLFGVTLIGYVSFYKAVSFFTGISLSGRAQGADFGKILAKMTWFWTDFVLRVGQGITRFSHAFTPAQMKIAVILFLVLAVGGLVFAPSRAWRSFRAATSVQRLVLLPLLVVLCYLPFIVVPEYGLDPIYATGIKSSLLLALCLGARNVLDFATEVKWKRRVEVGLAAVLFCLMALSASGNIQRNYVFPNHNEYSYVKSVVSKTDLTKITRIHVVGHLNFSDVLTYPETLVRGVLNEAPPPGVRPEVTSSSKTAPGIIHDEIFGRSKVLKEYYELDPAMGFYVIKPGLTIQQRAALDNYFAVQADAVAALPNVLVIDLSHANAAY